MSRSVQPAFDHFSQKKNYFACKSDPVELEIKVCAKSGENIASDNVVNCFIHLSLAFPGVDPGTPPGICF